MRKYLLITIFIVLFCASSLCAKSAVVALGDVLQNVDEFDEKMIEIKGEVIGEVLKTAQGSWINISSGIYSIGIFSDKNEAFDAISYWGNYKEIGDTLKVKGIFYKECVSHQIGDIHLESLEVIEQGYEKIALVSQGKIKIAIISFIICLTTAIIYLIKVKYGKST